MESQTGQSTVIDAEILQQIQNEIQQEISEILENSNFHKVLEKYSISGDKILKIKFQCSIDINKIQHGNTVDNEQIKKFLSEIIGGTKQELMLVNKLLCIPCPTNQSIKGCYC
ncbi:MAG: hypothetical protein RMY64_33525 [Nostoc sp. DedQUE08]|uniref:hypothetical protein n=1 Tax=unclassified Nostoc TaxID=2593658 RepID=UPI002AD590A3|nr:MULTISPECIES: hypothetical protein [unclassified Nostoc]MDZ8070476.1 hypothetical protein [Nostoc sp. DedQUE08]MDZ8093265.1 hypothetical protein [Nostoc sp. DedQUE05]